MLLKVRAAFPMLATDTIWAGLTEPSCVLGKSSGAAVAVTSRIVSVSVSAMYRLPEASIEMP